MNELTLKIIKSINISLKEVCFLVKIQQNHELNIKTTQLLMERVITTYRTFEEFQNDQKVEYHN